MGARLKLSLVYRDVRIYYGAATHRQPVTRSLVVFYGPNGEHMKRFKYVAGDARSLSFAHSAAAAFIDTLETSPEGV